jgi:hypothetical protein
MIAWLKGLLCDPKPKFSPNLIDLVEYEKTLLYAREHNKSPIPVMPWPSRDDWTMTELQYMRDNREKAKAIKEKVFPDDD